MAGARTKIGRPTDYTPELAAHICDLVATTDLSIANLCKTKHELPEQESTVFRWMREYPRFRQDYLEAKELQALIISEQVFDDARNCEEISESIAKQNHIFRVAQWHLSKLAPKQFGDKSHEQASATAIAEQVKEIASAVKELNNKHERDY